MSLVTRSFPTTRLRRLRRKPALRHLTRETRLCKEQLIYPLFIHHGKGVRQEVLSMPGQYQISIDFLEEEIQQLQAVGINAVLLFGIPESKDDLGSDSFSDDGIIQQACKKIKTITDDMVVITDVCLCEYNDHGHCGLAVELLHETVIDNDTTLEILAKQAISHARASADVVAPSGMMDGAVGQIRKALDVEGFNQIPILSYAVKYASAYYGPFRDATLGAPQFGDRKSYQMDPANLHRALAEVQLDINEGADMVMVKPAVPYSDVIYRIKQNFPELPLGAYHVSGEYAMIKAAAEKGWIDERKVVLEQLIGLCRAGADMIITYYAKRIAQEDWLSTKD